VPAASSFSLTSASVTPCSRAMSVTVRFAIQSSILPNRRPLLNRDPPLEAGGGA
jgi:hypothetical protein